MHNLYSKELPQHQHMYASKKRPVTVVSPRTALELLQEQAQRTEQNVCLIEGGPGWLRLGLGIIELCGPAGKGKTQLALSVCLQAAKRSAATIKYTSAYISNSPQATIPTQEPAAAIYIAMGTSNVSKIVQRLSQMADQNSHLLQRILTKPVVNLDDLHTLLYTELPLLLEQQNSSVRVLVLDSIADLFRDATENFSSIAARSAVLFAISVQLKKLSAHYHVHMLVLNQVTTKISSNDSSCLAPALGLSWAHCVDHSYMVDGQRCVTLVRSPMHATPQTVAFTIQTTGVVFAETRSK
jgi:predicted ATP-dependent serine protease